MRTLLSIFLILPFYSLSAQYYNAELDNLMEDVHIYSQSNNYGDGYEGSPYINDNFVEGSFLKTDSSFYNAVLMRYDAYGDNIEVHYKEQNFILGPKEEIQYVVIGADTLVVLDYYDGSSPEQAYFYLLYEGDDLSLYCKRGKSFKKADEPKPYHEALPARFQDLNDEYYWVKKGEDLVKVSNKRELKTFITDKDVLDYIKKEKLSLRKADDLTAIVKFYNKK